MFRLSGLCGRLIYSTMDESVGASANENGGTRKLVMRAQSWLLAPMFQREVVYKRVAASRSPIMWPLLT